jgi:hypothetical protein
METGKTFLSENTGKDVQEKSKFQNYHTLKPILFLVVASWISLLSSCIVVADHPRHGWHGDHDGREHHEGGEHREGGGEHHDGGEHR